MQSKIEELEKKLNYLYDKEVSRVLSESKLIEEIIRLEKLEERMAKMVGAEDKRNCSKAKAGK